ncbi:bacteriohemerythrin [Defluviitalea phaphyphila]|uniref:bacteriohemerythrin n=1 Tax=Defluviitalea phaphyphila TaxID=1473580 RepID=UPI0007309A82|nr:bacteriohemerythrin [Defluviitalea phaphyphila]
MAFEWKSEYSLDIPEIDAQHKKLFEIGNRAYELATFNDGYDHYDEIMSILNELLEYTKYHFSYEEELMEKYNSNELGTQIIEHKFYVKKIQSFSEEKIDEDQQKAILDILDFLSNWISSHILVSDKKYVPAIKEGLKNS